MRRGVDESLFGLFYNRGERIIYGLGCLYKSKLTDEDVGRM